MPTTPSKPRTPLVTTQDAWPRLRAWQERAGSAMSALPWWPVALLARFSLAAVFWKSGQTKVEGLAIDVVGGEFQLGWPSLAPQAVDLFRDEYRLPLLDPGMAAGLAATAEHLLPLALLAGQFTRCAALGLLGMTAVIQLLVYPGAYPTHGVWAALLLALMVHGPGQASLDHLWRRRR